MAQIGGAAGALFGGDPTLFLLNLTRRHRGEVAALNSAVVSMSGQREWSATAGGKTVTIDLAPGNKASAESQALALIGNILISPSIVQSAVQQAAMMAGTRSAMGSPRYAVGAMSVAMAGATGGAVASSSAGYIATAAGIAGIVAIVLPALASAAVTLFPIFLELASGTAGGPKTNGTAPLPSGGSGSTPEKNPVSSPAIPLGLIGLVLALVG